MYPDCILSISSLRLATLNDCPLPKRVGTKKTSKHNILKETNSKHVKTRAVTE